MGKSAEAADTRNPLRPQLRPPRQTKKVVYQDSNDNSNSN